MAVKSVNIISDQSLDKYDVIDQNLIPSKTFVRNFGGVDDYIEAHLYTKDDRLLLSNYNVKDYKIPATATSDTTLANSLEFDPAKYIQDKGYTVGDFKLEYRILRKKLFTIASPTFFISEISKDRTEIRLTSNTVSDVTLEENTLNFIYEIQSSQYFKDFLLNFGGNKLVNAVNIALDTNKSPYSVVVKLYRALPTEFDLKSALWVVEELADPITFEVELIPDPVVEQVQFLGPANFNVEIDTHKSVGSTYQSLSSIYDTNDIQAYQDVVNKLNTKSAGINVDYTEYNNFVHFSSAQQRLNNFFYKLQTIEGYNNDVSILTSVPNYSGSISVSSSIYTIKQSVNNLVKNMDGYEKFLYSATSSAAWPKYSGSLLYATDSTEGLTWFGDYSEDSPYYGGQSYTASLYDLENQDNLTNVVPEYLAIDEANADYLLFVNMLGQQFDEVWMYIKGMNDLYKAENSVSEGISKDMVFTALRSLGIKVYNSNSNQDVFEYFLGSASGSYTVTGSSATTSGEDASKEIFKRIYHNLPYLLKSKGSDAGLKGIISTYGIPDTILSVTEYGGSDKFSDTLEYVTDRFSYGYVCSGSNYVELPWAPLTQNVIKYGSSLYPDSIELRFKPDIDNIKSDVTLLQAYSESIVKFGVSMHYTSSEGVPSANVKFTLQNASSSLTLPLYATGSDGDSHWWNMLLKRNIKWTTSPNSSSYQVYQLDIQNGVSGKIGHTASLNLVAPGSGFEPINDAWGSNATLRIGAYAFTGSNFISGSEFLGKLQELRFWSEPLSGSYFNLHTLNNESIAESASYDNLAARFPLGNSINLAISKSIHPNVGIDYMSGNNSISFTGSVSYEPFYEYQYNSTNLGPVTDKVRVVDNTIEGEVLSPFLKLEDKELYRTKDSHFTDISFSPQSEIDRDILAQYGNTLNLDNFLGDPRVQYDRNYSRLELLKQAYYKKYINTLNYKDFIKLVDSFDNSLFKMLSDNAPAIANVSTGVTIKSPILERNRVKRYQPIAERNDYTASIGGQTISAGMPHANLTTGFEFYTGNLSGSLINLDEKFTENNFNEYALFKENLDRNKFEHSSFNVLHGNVSRQRVSNKFKKIDTYNDEILSEAELQDSYYSSKAYLLPRYEGSKSTSRLYNTYTPGDTAYGKNAAIYRNSVKFASVKSVNNLNFKYKTNAFIKYLIDASGSLTDLSRHNYNLFEVQNIFKSGDEITVSISDITNPSNQANLNGDKTIWKGGFSYDPILYRESNETLYFSFNTPVGQTTSNIGVKAFATSSYHYRADHWDSVAGIFGNPNNPTTNNTFDNYLYEINGSSANTNTLRMSYRLINKSQWKYDTSQYPGLNYTNVGTLPRSRPNDGNVYAFNLLDFNDFNGGYNLEPIPSTYQSYSGGNHYYKVPRTSQYQISSSILVSINGNDERRTTGLFGANEYFQGWSLFKIVGIVEKSSTPSDESSWTYVCSTKLDELVPNTSQQFDHNTNTIFFDNSWNNNCQFSCKIDMAATNTTVTLNSGEYIRFQFYWIDMENGFSSWRIMDFYLNGVFPGNTPLAKSFFEIKDTTTSTTTYLTTGSYGQVPTLFTQTSSGILPNDTLMFSSASYGLFYSSSLALTSKTKDFYSPVVDPLSIKKYDLFRLGGFESPYSQYYEVKDVQVVNSEVKVSFFESLNQTLYDGAQNFAFLRPKEDETSVIIDYKKNDGEISPTLLIPFNIKPDIKDKVADIVQNLIL